ncbi:MalY/PatB family protein [Timonella sp. A28]|uniref:MalY/PatB family protein n=1 Tax=Timonella sp. A28 TaxID=3442640 RepID=UPI003EBBD780
MTVRNLKPVSHAHHASVRWDTAHTLAGPDAIALSVADMDFAAPQEVTDAIVERAQRGNYCYTHLTDSYYRAVRDWFARRYNWDITVDEIIPAGRVIEALPAILNQLTPPHANIVVPYPAYGPIPETVTSTGRHVMPWHLQRETNYNMDFAAATELFTTADALILTNPHNPTGRVWNRQELTQLADLARAHNVLVISDEVHADLAHSGNTFVPYLTCTQQDDQAIALLSPGKTFNIAGLETLNIVIRNPQLRATVQSATHNAGNHNPRFFAQAAVEAAYTHAEPWLNELLTLVEQHITILDETLHTHLPAVTLIRPQGTYLAWIDCRALNASENTLTTALHNNGLVLTPGSAFGAEGYYRINLATPTPTFREALNRLVHAFTTELHAEPAK